MFYILLSTAIILGFALLGALVLDYFDDESGRSILYDDPEYFKHDEPEWLREEAKDDET